MLEVYSQRETSHPKCPSKEEGHDKLTCGPTGDEQLAGLCPGQTGLWGRDCAECDVSAKTTKATTLEAFVWA